jgi:hypothetical protein
MPLSVALFAKEEEKWACTDSLTRQKGTNSKTIVVGLDIYSYRISIRKQTMSNFSELLIRSEILVNGQPVDLTFRPLDV